MTRSRFTPVQIGCLLLLISMTILAAGLAYSLYTWSWLNRSEHTTGVVVEMIDDSEGGGEAPRVEYVVNDRTYEYQSSTYRTFGPYRVGSEVPILYDPRQPGRAKMDAFSEIWLFPLLLTASGAIMFLIDIPLFFYFSSRRTPDHL
jgi:hypothetical protein